MIRICDLPRGWTLWANTLCHEIKAVPVFRNRRGLEITPLDMASRPEAPVIFNEIKRLLDIADRERLPGSDMRFRGLDLAKIALQISLGMVEKWRPDLLETGVGA